MNDGQNSDCVAASAESVNTPAYDGSKSPAKAITPIRNSTLAEGTATLLTNSMKRKPYTHTARTSPANRAYATTYDRLPRSRPNSRCAPPTRASPELHTEIEKNATAVSSDRNEPTTRPCTPRCAEEETALLVPLTGPNTAIGHRIRAPATTPSSVAARPCQKERPNRIGKAPRTQVEKVLAPPKARRNRSSGVAVRSASGMRSTPWDSTSVKEGAGEGSSG